jgi:xanthine dehydrogenase small subunit
VIVFILNNELIKTDMPPGMSLLDFIRNVAGLKGTKSGCKEGDCGACTVLSGKPENDEVSYKTIVSCLTPLGNVHGRHIVTVEGINNEQLTPVQQQIVENHATQCGFCTPGIVVSLTGFSFKNIVDRDKEAVAAVAGNICRCTGYKSIEKAAMKVVGLLKEKDDKHPVDWLITNGFIPEYFKNISGRLKNIPSRKELMSLPDINIAGGTDLMVQKSHEIKISSLKTLRNIDDLSRIEVDDEIMTVGGAVTVNELFENNVFNRNFQGSKKWVKLISSEQIRNMATIAGNFVNASPIGDMSVLFLALEAELKLVDANGKVRNILLSDFFVDYKKINKKKDEIIKSISFKLPGNNFSVNFEKVSKRIHLDIASVNTAIKIDTDGKYINKAVISAGGVAPVPKCLQNVSEYLRGKKLTTETLKAVLRILDMDIAPISDIRGSSDYKRLLLRQLIVAHFVELFPERFVVNEDFFNI